MGRRQNRTPATQENSWQISIGFHDSFKAAAKRLALELREEVGLDGKDRFDPYELAALYGIEVLRLSDLDCSAAVRYFTQENPGALSGALIPFGSQLIALDHDGHSAARRRATLGHEMAHVILEHRFMNAALLDTRGCRTSDPEQEEEATELSGELLIPTQAAIAMALKSMDDVDVAEKMDVSVEFARWRMNVSGARKIARRRQRQRASWS